MQPIFIAGLNAGVETDKKPFLLPDQAWQTLNNAYCWRERILKREGITLIGRLRRLFTATSIGNSGASPWTFNLFATVVPPIVETNKELQVGSLIININAGAIILIDQGDGTLATSPPSGVTGIVNYITGSITITGAGAGLPTVATFGYFPSLPVMGIIQRNVTNINQDQTIFFDTTYAYIFVGSDFQEFILGTTWNALDYKFFWGANYRGVTPDIRLFFVTNFQNDANNPMRYTDGTTWTTFAPLVSATVTLYNAQILIPYYGRLLALNVWEGTTAGGPAGAVNIFNRCRFSAIGNPVAVDAWRSDIFGKGGFIDAPTNEEIISAIFYKNTLIVGFERSTWQLRYVGEYGLPFIWERISSDFGMESTFSSVLFDDGVLAVGDRAITQATSNSVKRIDLQIPDTVFGFSNVENGPERVQSVRDFQKELIYWTVPTAGRNDGGIVYKFPDGILLYNYRNNTYAEFRENVTALGTFQSSTLGVTWDSTDVTWDDNVLWNDSSNEPQFPNIALGNQEGFIHIINDGVLPDPSLSVTGVTITAGPQSVNLTIVNHNLREGEFIYLTDLLFVNALNVPVTSNLNNSIFSIYSVVDANTVQLSQWDGFSYVTDFTVTPASPFTYIGGGQATLIWKLLAQTKDFNPFQNIGRQFFLSYVDFQVDATATAIFSINLNLNASDNVKGNLIVGNQLLETYTYSQNFQITGATQTNPCVITSIGSNIETGTQVFIQGVGGMTQLNNNTFIATYIDPDTFSLDGINATAFTAYTVGGNWIPGSSRFYTPDGQYGWHRFYATATGQYINLSLTYNDSLMNNIATHNQMWTLNAMSLFMRPAGRLNL